MNNLSPKVLQVIWLPMMGTQNHLSLLDINIDIYSCFESISIHALPKYSYWQLLLFISFLKPHRINMEHGKSVLEVLLTE